MSSRSSISRSRKEGRHLTYHEMLSHGFKYGEPWQHQRRELERAFDENSMSHHSRFSSNAGGSVHSSMNQSYSQNHSFSQMDSHSGSFSRYRDPIKDHDYLRRGNEGEYNSSHTYSHRSRSEDNNSSSCSTYDDDLSSTYSNAPPAHFHGRGEIRVYGDSEGSHQDESDSQSDRDHCDSDISSEEEYIVHHYDDGEGVPPDGIYYEVEPSDDSHRSGSPADHVQYEADGRAHSDEESSNGWSSNGDYDSEDVYYSSDSD